MAKNIQDLKAKAQAVNGNGSTEVAVAESKPKTVAQQVHEALDKLKPQLAVALPKHITADRLARIALTTIRTTPALMECSIESLLASIMQAAQLGLEPGLLGQCYLVPYWNSKKGMKEAQFIIGYKGLLSLARRSGDIASIAAEAIYSNDTFKYRKGFEEVLEHEPNFKDRGELIAFYAYATTKDGGRYATVMTKQDIEKIRTRSKAKDNGPWVTDYEEMGKKTALRRLTKYLPMSVEISETVRKDEQLEFGNLQPGDEIQLNLGSPETTQAAIEVGTAAEVSTAERRATLKAQAAQVSEEEIAEDETRLASNEVEFELQE